MPFLMSPIRLCGSLLSPATGVTPLAGDVGLAPVPLEARAGTPAVACQVGTAKVSLTPPPPAPPLGASFHTVSDVIAPVADTASVVPPQASACGDDAGKSTCGCPSETPSEDPLSPAATQTVMPSAQASAIASSSAVRPCAVHESSDWPHEMEITTGAGEACAASDTESTNPWSEFGAKYTSCVAPGAAAPATSMSSATSTSAPVGSEPGSFATPSTDTAVTEGTAMPSPPKYVVRSEVSKPPPSSTSAMICPAPSAPAGNP